MALTLEQLQAIRAAIDADPALSAQPEGPDGAFAIAAAFNLPAEPTFFVWRDSVPISEIMGNGFDWTLVDNLSAGKARIWEWMTQLGAINPSQANVRAGIIAAISGTGAAFPTMRTAVFGHCQAAATRAEKLFATGSGTTSNDQGVGPGTRTFAGLVSYTDVLAARAM